MQQTESSWELPVPNSFRALSLARIGRLAAVAELAVLTSSRRVPKGDHFRTSLIGSSFHQHRKRKNPTATMLSRTLLSRVCKFLRSEKDAKKTLTSTCAATAPAGRPAGIVAPAQLRAATASLGRHTASHRPRRGLGARRALHEGHARAAAVRLLSREHPDPGHAGRRPGQVRRLQRARGRGAAIRCVPSWTKWSGDAVSLVLANKDGARQESRSTPTGPPFRSSTSTRNSSAGVISSCPCTRTASWRSCWRRRRCWLRPRPAQRARASRRRHRCIFPYI